MDKILKLQTEIGVLSKTETNPFFKSKYMDINGLLAQLLPLLEKYKLCVIQPLCCDNNGRPAIETVVFDLDSADMKKEIVRNYITLPDLTDPQKMGSAITYYRRYSLQSLFLLQSQDDDANYASKEHTIQIDSTYTKPMNKKDYVDLTKKAVAAEANGEEPF